MHTDAAAPNDATTRANSGAAPAPQGQVRVERQPLTLPTQLPDQPDRYPAYLDNRVYQGMSGAVYPLPFHERIQAESHEHVWDSIHVSNSWVEIVVLPELGGRIAWGIDKTRDYDMFYKNQVVKPALVGLSGPWISGGIEFNWPQHHRPATFLPTTAEIEHEDDGSVTIWCSDHDPFTRMKGMHGIRLRPDSAVIELRVRLFNRTDDVQKFLWWANVAARSGQNYQAFFPTDVHFVADHARRAITAFPAADRPYYGWDYPAAAEAETGADRIDFYRNIRVPTSYMCLETTDDYFGGYDHEVGAGFIHVADHRISPGKKLWTWGNSSFGWAWDRNLTEVDGPYVELMAGVYTDNQPDFSFLGPGETKTFSQFWYPIQDIGPAQQANLDAACSLTVDAERVRIGVAVPVERPDLSLRLVDGSGSVVWEESHTAGPGRPVVSEITLGRPVETHELTLSVRDGDDVLLTWTPRQPVSDPVEPDAATQPSAPSDIESNDELYLTGLHVEQYSHATNRPEPYWNEAIRRDPGDARCRTALAVACLRRGELDVAEDHLRHAIARLTRRNPNPYDTEALYRLGQVLDRQGRVAEALDTYGKSAWSLTWRDAAALAMARLMAVRGDNVDALELVTGNGTDRDPKNQARCLEVILLRRLRRHDEAQEVLAALRRVDPLDVWAADLEGVRLATDPPTLLDVALEYASVGEFDAALELLHEVIDAKLPLGQVNVAPLAHLHRADLLERMGRTDDAQTALQAADQVDATWCFASRPADLDLLVSLAHNHPDHALVHRLLGHLLYHLGRRPEAMYSWKRAVELEDTDPVTRRNLAVASYNITDDPSAADLHYARARELARKDPKLLFEHDQLRKRTGTDPAARLRALEPERDVVLQRDDLTTEFVQLLTSQDRAHEALGILEDRHFQPWEGGEGQVLTAWEETMLALARTELDSRNPEAAQELLRRALEPPSNLGEDRHPLANYSSLMLTLGDAQAALGHLDEARQAWQQGATFIGDFKTMETVPYSEMTYYSALAWQRLGDQGAADHLATGLADYADKLEAEPPTIDYFATSMPSLLLFTDDLERRTRVDVAVLRAQVAMLRGEDGTASQHLDEALAEDPNNVRALSLTRERAQRPSVDGADQ